MDQEEAKMDIEEQANRDKSAEEEEEDEVFTDGVRNGPGFVYLLSEHSQTDGQVTHYYKIGATSNPAKRVADLQTGNPRPLHLQGEPMYVSRVISAERSIHKAVARYASKLGGGQEWFYVPQQDWKHFWEGYQKAIKPYLCMENAEENEVKTNCAHTKINYTDILNRQQ